MSLINDALKRAKEAQGPPARLPGPSLRPVEPEGHARHTVGLLVPVILAVMALLALFLVWQVRSQRAAARQTGGASTEVYKEVSVNRQTTPTAAAEPVPSRVPAPSAPIKSVAPTPGPTAAVSTPVAKASEAPGPRPADINVAALASAQAAALSETTTQSTTGTVSTVSTTVTPVQQAPKLPPLVLQGVVYNPKRPSAVISGKSLFIGDRIRDFRVVAITVETATLVSARQTNVLTLAD